MSNGSRKLNGLWPRLTVIAGLLGLLVLAGCKDENQYRLLFSHYVHVVDAEMACDECHGDISPDGFSRMSHDTCIDCHDEPEAEKVSEKTCGICHQAATREEIEAQASNRTRYEGGIFVHTEHLEGKCSDCHADLLDEDLTSVPQMGRFDRVRRRNEFHSQGKACETCHVDMAPDVAPANHRADWKLRHGAFGLRDDAACSVCHTEHSCRECHEVTQPANHNLLWRTKTHGIHATWDRQSCQTCHETDSCQTCHEEVRPRSHNAGWSRSHCYSCHTSAAAGQGCAVCHQDGLIETHPNPHEAGFRSRHCYSCHPGTPEARSCEVCHPGGFEQHPNPHPGGWKRRHCDSCHEDSPRQDRCNLCHDTTVDNHPNPHSNGWKSRHCNNCHAGSSSANECGECHSGARSLLVHEDFWPPVHNRFGDSVSCDICHF